MTKKWNKLVLAVLTISALCAVVGCGNTASKQTNSKVTTTAETTTKSGYKIGPSLQKIISNGKLIVGCDNSYAPFSFIDTTSTSKDPIGIDIEIGKAIAAEIGVPVKLEPMLFKALLPSLSTNMLDVAIDGITPTDERKKVVNFSESYIQCEDRMIIKKANVDKYKTLQSFYGTAIAANTGSIQEKFTRDFIKEAKVFSSPNLPTSILELQADHVVGIVVEKSVGQQYVAAYPNLAFSDAKMEGSYAKTYAVAYGKGNDDLGLLINGVVKKLVADKKIDEWRNKYSEIAAKAVLANKK